MVPSGCSTKTSRSTNGAKPGSVSPLPSGATGIRRSLARCNTSSVVCAVVNVAISARSIRSCSPRRSTRPSSGWSAHSGWPTISAKARNCAEPLVAKPTQPSAVGSTDGTSTKRPIGSGSGPRPSSCAATAWNWLNAIVIASNVDTSTNAPLSAAPRPVQRGQRGDAADRARDPLADAATGGDRRFVLPTAAGDRAAPGLQRELGRRAVRPRSTPTEPRDRDHHDGRGPPAQRRHVVPEPLRELARVTGDDDVGVDDQRLEERAVVGQVRIERGVALGGVQQREQRGLGAEGIPRGSFDLHDLGARVGEQLRGVRAGDPRRQVDDAHVVERRVRHGSLGRPSSRSPTMLRWIWWDPP